MSDENVALEIGGELLHIVLTAPPPRMADMRLADGGWRICVLLTHLLLLLLLTLL